MGQYKVPQDVEAEDKIIGPLTLKQFIYAIIGVGWGFISFSIFRGAPILFVVFGIPVALLFLLLGLYRRQDRPFETIFLALMNYFFRPRQRIWQKEMVSDVFIPEPPQQVEQAVVRNPQEVVSQLERVARLIDSRGWSAKRPEIQEPEPELSPVIDLKERLALPAMPQGAAAMSTDVNLADDILDFQNNPSAQSLNTLIQDSVKNIRAEALTKMKSTPAKGSVSGMTPTPSPDILKLAMENNDLSVSQIAAQAGRHLTEGQPVSLRHAAKKQAAKP